MPLSKFLIFLAIVGEILGAGPAPKSPDACALIPKSVIEKVQGEPVRQSKGTSSKSGTVFVAQCVYSLTTSSNSISVALTLPDPAGSKTGAREFWERSFHKSDRDKDAGEEGEKEIPPAPISGLGEEAYWVRSFVGTLYVLKGDAFLRISIGGKQDDAARLKKAQTLAEAALANMP